MNIDYIETKEMSVGQKLMIIANRQAMVLEVLPSKDGGMLVYRSPHINEIMYKVTPTPNNAGQSRGSVK